MEEEPMPISIHALTLLYLHICLENPIAIVEKTNPIRLINNKMQTPTPREQNKKAKHYWGIGFWGIDLGRFMGMGVSKKEGGKNNISFEILG
uniref:Uncharacterized protein n=1 Tax=Gossypium raimondii TaxID=29730 RepID=A0A0D2PQQ1_GOSRA|nr:hypothetical protein B456_005G099000 [Gossypium raimondii]